MRNEYLDLALESAGKEYPADLFPSIKITEETFDKICIYAKLVCEETGRDLECLGYLLSDTEKFDGIVTDALLMPKQKVYSGYAIPVDPAQAFRQLREAGKKVIGLWHSHANFGTFHSSTDDDHLEGLVTDLRKNKNLLVGSKREVYGIGPFKARYDEDSGIFEVSPSNLHSKKLIFQLSKDGMKEMRGIEDAIKGILEEKMDYIGFSYSIVINKNSFQGKQRVKDKSYYAEARFEDPKSRSELIINKNLPLEFIAQKNNIEDREEVLRSHIRDSIVYEQAAPIRVKKSSEPKSEEPASTRERPTKHWYSSKKRKGVKIDNMPIQREGLFINSTEVALPNPRLDYLAVFKDLESRFEKSFRVSQDPVSRIGLIEFTAVELKDFINNYHSSFEYKPSKDKSLKDKMEIFDRKLRNSILNLEKDVKRDIEKEKKRGIEPHLKKGDIDYKKLSGELLEDETLLKKYYGILDRIVKINLPREDEI